MIRGVRQVSIFNGRTVRSLEIAMQPLIFKQLFAHIIHGFDGFHRSHGFLVRRRMYLSHFLMAASLGSDLSVLVYQVQNELLKTSYSPNQESEILRSNALHEHT